MGAVFYVQVRDDPELVKLEDRVDKRARRGSDLRQEVSRESVTCRFVREFLCVIFKYLVGLWHVSGGFGHPGGHAGAL